MKTIHAVAAAAALCGLSACGGGGGGGGVREVPFTSFPVSNQRVVMTGISETIGGTTDVSGTQVLSLDANTVLDTAGNSSMRLTYGGSSLTQISVSSPASSVSFGQGTVDCSTPPLCTALSGLNEVVIVDPAVALPFAWNYQTFGVWLQPSGTNFRAGAISAGAVTPAMPTSAGTVNFSGLTSGFYVQGQNAFATASTMTADVDFSLRSINFATQNTTTVSFAGGPAMGNPSLDFNGNVIYNPGSNQFVINVNTTNCCLNMTGNVNGRFYGPAAQEMGGVFSLSDVGGGNRMLGAFGAKRP